MQPMNLRNKRLQKEFVEIQKCPVMNIVATPLNEENLEEWHGNVTGDAGTEGENVIVHFKMFFPQSYPASPPRILLCTFVPHLNVQRGPNNTWEVCLDMLTLPRPGQAMRPYEHWTAAFTVRSILVQLKSFVLADGHMTATQDGTLLRAISESSAFECISCGHVSSHPCPPFPCARQVEAAPVAYPIMPIDATSLAKLHARRQTPAPCSEESSCIDAKNTVSEEKIEEKEKEDDWIPVSRKRSRAISPAQIAAPKSHVDHNEDNIFYELEDVSLLLAVYCGVCGCKRPSSEFSGAQLKKPPATRRCKGCLQSAIHRPLDTERSMSLSKAIGKPHTIITSKNFLRREKRRLAKQRENVRNDLMDVGDANKDEGKDVARQPSNTLCPMTDDSSSCQPPSHWKFLYDAHRSAGPFAKLSRETNNTILTFLSGSDALAFGASCTASAQIVDDWWLWMNQFKSRFPRSSLQPQGQGDEWRFAYMLEVNGLSGSMQCFVSHNTAEEDVLGCPVVYTINPVKHELDYITSTFDVISHSAYSQSGVRRSAWGEKFDAFLPYYINENHFIRALPILSTLATKLCGQRHLAAIKSSRPKEFRRSSKKKVEPEESLWIPKNASEMILELLAKMMNTQVVLLCDKGVAVCDVALQGYCQLHRLLLAMVRKFPALQHLVNRRIGAFLTKSTQRTKEQTPSLGELLALVSVSNKYSWQQISLPYFLESIDRSVLWACTRDVSLATVVRGDDTRLERHFAAAQVGLRLTMFHAVFLNVLVQGGGSDARLENCTSRYDIFQGRPPIYVQRVWVNQVKRVLATVSWPAFFSLCRISVPSKQFMLKTLEDAVGNSIRKGYHSATTNFNRIHSSGVSKILLKGESYSTDPNLSSVRMCEQWRYRGETIYLDASCLIYDFNKSRLGYVDYASMVWGNGCVRHSGDVIDHERQLGEHTIDIDIKQLPPSVATLVFTVSAWTTDLKEIQQPSAHLIDSKNNVELCRYKHEDVDTGHCTAVIMCKLHRRSRGERWRMESIGHVGMGRAGTYAPIEKNIENLI